MSENREFICVTCPVGCTIQVTVEDDGLLSLDGQACARGAAFVREELTAPKRMLTTTVRVEGGVLPLVPVRTTEPVPLGLLPELVRLLREVRLMSPVEERALVLGDALGSGVDVITSRSVPRAAVPSA